MESYQTPGLVASRALRHPGLVASRGPSRLDKRKVHFSHDVLRPNRPTVLTVLTSPTSSPLSSPKSNPTDGEPDRFGARNSNRFRQSLDALGRERLLPLKDTCSSHTNIAPTYDPFSSPSFLANLAGRGPPKRRSSVQDLSLPRTSHKPRRRSVELGPGRRRSIEIGSIPTSPTNRRRSVELSEAPEPDTPSSPGGKNVVSNCPTSFSTKNSTRTFRTPAVQRRQLQPLPGAVARGRKRSISEAPQRLTAHQKAALCQQQQRSHEARTVEAWERVFRGVERQMQYADSLCTATKLPELGRIMEGAILGNMEQLRQKMAAQSQGELEAE